MLIERLVADKNIRIMCGWEYPGQVPSESTFSRAFAEFADSGLTNKVHEALAFEHLSDDVVWHVSRDCQAMQ